MKNSALKWLLSVPGGKNLYIALLALAQGLFGGSGVLYALLLRSAVDAAWGRIGLSSGGGSSCSSC